MDPTPSRRAATVLLATFVTFAAPEALALDLSGSLSDATTGPIPAGVHRVVGSLDVPAGQTLTIQDGAILKFGPTLSFTVLGTLKANGTAGTGISFTSIADDTIGGDTNGDGGATTPAPGDWQGVIVSGSATGCVLTACDLRYHGFGGISALFLSGGGSQLALNGCRVRDGATHGLDANAQVCDLTVAGCSFENNAQIAMTDLRIEHCAGLSGSSATGNGGDYPRVSQPDPTADLTIGADNALGGVIVITSTCDVPGGVTLTLGAGLVVKTTTTGTFWVTGSLVANGTAAQPVVVTDFADDDHGGDTNGDGPSNGAPGHHGGILVQPGAVVDLDHAIVRYTGAIGFSAIFVNGAGAQVKLVDCTLADGSFHGLDANLNPCAVTVTGCAFQGFQGDAATDLRIEQCAGFTGNTAVGNGGDFLRVGQPDPVADVTITAANCLGGALVLPTSCDVPAGVTLRLEAGVVLKLLNGTGVSVAGALVTAGTNEQPVVITSYADDDFGGDTNGDGPSAGTPGAIRGVSLQPGSTASVLEYAVVRYSGFAGSAGVQVVGAGTALTLEKSVLADGSGHGIHFNGIDADIAATGCAFVNLAGTAVEGLRLDRCQNFLDNAAVGNGGDFMRVTSPDPVGQVVLDRLNCLNGALVFAAGCTVAQPHSLTLKAGVVVKFEVPGGLLTTSGILRVEGTPDAPVVLTHVRDDAIAGDTNGDGGATVATPGLWQGVRVQSTAGASSLEHLVVRYAGWNGWNALRSESPSLVARAVRSDRCGASDGD
ncbi:MAG: hypothetical protein ACF8XB_21465, partial [Planctomycetota bacterium JB042]